MYMVSFCDERFLLFNAVIAHGFWKLQADLAARREPPNPNRRSQSTIIWSLVVQSLSHARLFAAAWTAARQASLSIIHSPSVLKLMSIELLMSSNHLTSVTPFSSCLQSFPVRWPKFWSFSFSISPSNEYSGVISFRIDWFDLLAVQETLKSLLQHHISKASVLWHSAFFMVQLSHLYMTTGKPIALTRWTFIGKVMSLLFNMLSRFVIAFLPRSSVF